MSKTGSAAKIKLNSYEDLFGSEEQNASTVQELALTELYEFKDHPFKVLDDEKMQETVESIKIYGVLIPGIARPRAEGGYEIIAGHRRKHGCELAGLSTMPMFVRDYSDDEATVIMVDSNIQREDLLPSEKAFAYKMKYDALKRLGHTDNTGRNDEKLAKEAGESRNTIQRYIRLTYLHSDLLQMVDIGKLPKNTAADISYLQLSEQKILLQIMQEQKGIPSGGQALKLKEYSKAGTLSETVMQLVLERKEEVSRVSLNGRDIRKYFPENYTGKQIEDVIYKLLEEWKKQEKNTL